MRKAGEREKQKMRIRLWEKPCQKAGSKRVCGTRGRGEADRGRKVSGVEGIMWGLSLREKQHKPFEFQASILLHHTALTQRSKVLGKRFCGQCVT